MTETTELVAELRWAIDHNQDRPRTEAALRWALEAVEELTKREVKT